MFGLKSSQYPILTAYNSGDQVNLSISTSNIIPPCKVTRLKDSKQEECADSKIKIEL